MKTLPTTLLVFILVLSLIPSQLVHADANKLFVTPAASQMNLNTSFTVNIRTYADTDQTIGNAHGSVTFPSNQLRVSSISISGSGYGAPTISQSTGRIGFTASRNPAPGGSAQLFLVTFTAIGAGTAAVGFTGDSSVNDAPTTYSSGVFTIIDPNPAPTPPNPSTKPATPKPTPAPIITTPSTQPETPSSDNEPVATPDPTGLVDSVIVNPLYSSSTVSWKINAAHANATLLYGTSSTKLEKAAAVTSKPDGTFEASVTGLNPGLRYFFTINATAEGGRTGTYSSTIITRGYPITITVTENKVPVQSGLLKIGNINKPITSTNGKITLGLAADSYTGTITTETASLTINITVQPKTIPADGSAPETQSFSYNLSSSPLDSGPGTGFSIFAFIGFLFGGAVLLGGSFVGFMAYRRHKFESGDDDSGGGQGSTVIIDDGYDWHPPTQSSNEPDLPPAPPIVHSAPPPDAPPGPGDLEVEPLDMFEQAELRSPLLYPHPPSQTTSPGIEQNPSSPHSTRL
jgi:hypothetical protein